MRGDLGKKVGASVAVAVTGGAMLLALGAVMGRLWLAAGGVACGLITLVVLRDRPIPDCPPPTWGERALALAGVGSQLGAVGLMWWALYWALRGVGSVVERVSGLDIDPRSIAFWLTLAWLGPVTLVAAGRAAGTMMRELYPATGLHSTYYDVLRFRRAELRRRVWIVLGGAALLALVSLDLDHETVGLLWLWAFALLAGLFAVPAATGLSGGGGASDVKGFAKAVVEAGWEVVPNPRIGNEAVDPFLAEADLFAFRAPLSMLMKVVQRGDAPDPSSWARLATLLTAARELPPEELPAGVETVAPALVLIEVELETAPLEFAAQHDIALLVIESRDEAHGTLVRSAPELHDALDAFARAYAGDAGKVPA